MPAAAERYDDRDRSARAPCPVPRATNTTSQPDNQIWNAAIGNEFLDFSAEMSKDLSPQRAAYSLGAFY